MVKTFTSKNVNGIIVNYQCYSFVSSIRQFVISGLFYIDWYAWCRNELLTHQQNISQNYVNNHTFPIILSNLEKYILEYCSKTRIDIVYRHCSIFSFYTRES